MKRQTLSIVVSILGAVVLTTFGIDAADTLSNRSGTLLGNALAPKAPSCPEHMADVALPSMHLCVDVFEATAGASCSKKRVESAIDTRALLAESSCVPGSEEGEVPWTFVTMNQAHELCAKAGKRLPTPEEWYRVALGSPDQKDVCNITGATLREGKGESSCKNAFGIYNAIGNAWEWVDGTVKDGAYNAVQIPASGYVVQANETGIATLTSDTSPNPDYKNDYFWSDQAGEYGILRGGFYGSGDDAGLYSVQAKTSPALSSGAIGFRCVKERDS
jgi:hypothetical protein